MKHQASDRKPVAIEWIIDRLMQWVGDDLEEGINVSLRRKQFVISSIPWLLAALVVFYNVVFLITGNLRTMMTGFVQIPFMLAGIWLAHQGVHLPEWVTGFIGVVLLALSLADSLRQRRHRGHSET